MLVVIMTFKLKMRYKKTRRFSPASCVPSFTQGLVKVGLDCVQEVCGVDVVLIELHTVTKARSQISKTARQQCYSQQEKVYLPRHFYFKIQFKMKSNTSGNRLNELLRQNSHFYLPKNNWFQSNVEVMQPCDWCTLIFNTLNALQNARPDVFTGCYFQLMKGYAFICQKSILTSFVLTQDNANFFVIRNSLFYTSFSC